VRLGSTIPVFKYYFSQSQYMLTFLDFSRVNSRTQKSAPAPLHALGGFNSNQAIQSRRRRLQNDRPPIDALELLLEAINGLSK
jgi:hypothetical protein